MVVYHIPVVCDPCGREGAFTFAYSADGLDEIPQRCGILELKGFGSLVHTFLKITDDGIVFPKDKMYGIFNITAVILNTDIPGTGGAAAMYLVVQAWTGYPD